MVFYALVMVVVYLFATVVVNSAENCLGFRQNVTIPHGYVKHVPDAYFTDNVTDVVFNFSIKQIKEVVAERYAIQSLYDLSFHAT